MGKVKLYGGIIGIVTVLFIAQSFFFPTKYPQVPTETKTEQTVVKTDTFTYPGKTGIDALTLLKERAAVAQDSSGLVVQINSRKADEKKREYWSFYINGKPSSVGSKEYVTKSSDQIEWKIETY